MGGPKALADVAGRPWWRWQEDRLERIGLKRTWVVSDRVEAALRCEDDAPARRVLSDADARLFDSLVVGVTSLCDAPPRGVFVLPVDVPVASAKVWSVLAAADGLAVPEHDGSGGHPAYLPWRFVTEFVLDPPPGSPRRLDHLLAGAATRVPVSDADVAVNLNTPDDVARWLERST